MAVLSGCRDTGLVVDCGFTDTRCVAVFGGTVALQTHRVAGSSFITVLRTLRNLIAATLTASSAGAAVDGDGNDSQGAGDDDRGAPLLAADVPWEYVEDVAVRGGFVGTVACEDPDDADDGCASVTLPRRTWLHDASLVSLPGKCRWLPYEDLFIGEVLCWECGLFGVWSWCGLCLTCVILLPLSLVHAFPWSDDDGGGGDDNGGGGGGVLVNMVVVVVCL